MWNISYSETEITKYIVVSNENTVGSVQEHDNKLYL